MPTGMCEAARDRDKVTFTTLQRPDTETSGAVTEAVRDVREAIRLVKTSVERFVSRAAEIRL